MITKIQLLKRSYDEIADKYREVEDIAKKQLLSELGSSNISVMQLQSRIKSWESVEEKLIKKPERYEKVEDLTDLLGIRVICFFLSQIDDAALAIKRLFDVDTEHSEDKRLSIPPDAFGYISLHITCRLKKNMGYPEELTNFTFEIQLRTILQHAWAEIEHDLGYKTVLEVPRDVRREFSRIAGLLEIADNSFEKIKDSISEYEAEILDRIRTDTADQMTLDIYTLNYFMEHSNAMQKLYDDMAGITGGRIVYVGAEEYLRILMEMGVESLGDLRNLVSIEHDHMLKLLKRSLNYSDLEEITSNAALFYIVRARLIWGGYTDKEIRDIYYRSSGDKKAAENSAKMIEELREELREG